MTPPRHSRRLFLGSIAVAGFAADQPNPIRLLVVTGGHGFDPSFFNLFPNRPEWKWEHRAHKAKSSSTAFAEPFADQFDAVVLYDMPNQITEAEQANFLALFERGVGVVVLHHAVVGQQQWPQFEEIVGVRLRKKGDGGLPPYDYKHDVDFELQRVDVKHPVLDGVPTFSVHDETYGKMYFHGGIQPLLVTNEPTSIGIVAWAKTYRNSRLVMIQPGHGPQIYQIPHFQRLLSNSVKWVAKR